MRMFLDCDPGAWGRGSYTILYLQRAHGILRKNHWERDRNVIYPVSPLLYLPEGEKMAG